MESGPTFGSRSAWAADKGALPDWSDGGQPDWDVEIVDSCECDDELLDGHALFDAAKSEHIADVFAQQTLMPAGWVNDYIAGLLASGRVLDEAALDAMCEDLQIERRVGQRWLAYLEATGQVRYGSNHGVWDRGDQIEAETSDGYQQDCEPPTGFSEADV